VLVAIRYRSRTDYQFGARLAFMQLLKASALLPAVDSAAWRSHSDASRLEVVVLRPESDEEELGVSYGPGPAE
jgi:hypothetical protein